MDPKAQPAPVEDLEQEQVEDIEVPEDAAESTEKTIDPEEDAAVADEMKTLTNQKFAAMRKEATEAKRSAAEMQKKIAQYEAERRAPVQAAPVLSATPGRQREVIGGIPVPENKAEWDALARQDWQTAVDLRSIINSRRVQEESCRVDAATRTMEEAKNKVLDRHPELADASSEKGQIFLRILDKNPDYLTMSKGPILAMRDMEEEMESMGFTREQIFDTKKSLAKAEATRVNRGALTGGGRMPEKSARTVTLSKDDMEFCRVQGLDPKEYAKEKLNIENNRKGAQL